MISVVVPQGFGGRANKSRTWIQQIHLFAFINKENNSYCNHFIANTFDIFSLFYYSDKSCFVFTNFLLLLCLVITFQVDLLLLTGNPYVDVPKIGKVIFILECVEQQTGKQKILINSTVTRGSHSENWSKSAIRNFSTELSKDFTVFPDFHEK